MHLTASLLLASLHPQPLTVRFPCLQVPLILQLQRASRQETLSKRLQSLLVAVVAVSQQWRRQAVQMLQELTQRLRLQEQSLVRNVCAF
jgi:hypothetical protein